MTDYRPLIEKDVRELAESMCSANLYPYDLSFSLFVNQDGTLDSLSNVSSALQDKSHMVNLLGAGYTGSCLVKVIRDGYSLENEEGFIRFGYIDSKVETYGFEVILTNPDFYAILPHPFIAPNQLGTFEVEGGVPQEPVKRKYGANHYYFPHVVKTVLNVDGIENFTKFNVNF